MPANGTIDQCLRTSVRSSVNERRDVRVCYRAPICVLWDEYAAQPKYAKAVSCDISERGLGFETSQRIAVGTYVSLRSESGGLFGDAKVRHATKSGSQYFLGVEFGYRLLDPAWDFVREIHHLRQLK